MAFDKLSLLLAVLGIVGILSFFILNVNAVTVNNTGWSIEVPNGWVYRQNFPIFINNTLLTPNEYADILITDNASVLTDPFQSKAFVEIAPDHNFPIKNAPVDIYAEHEIKKFTFPFVHKSENASIGGDRAIKAYINGPDLVNGTKIGNISISPKSNVTTTYKSIIYFVIHNDRPYYLSYMANNIEKYQKYLPQFEKIVKTLKFTK